MNKVIITSQANIPLAIQVKNELAKHNLDVSVEVVSPDPSSDNHPSIVMSKIITDDTLMIIMSKGSSDVLYGFDTKYPSNQVLSSGSINDHKLWMVQLDDTSVDKLLGWIDEQMNSKSLAPTLESEFDIQSARTYQEFSDYVASHLADATEIAYDLETNSGDVDSLESEVIGFSLSARGSRSGIYVILRSCDYIMPSKDKRATESLLSELSSKASKLIVHNLGFEVPQTRTWLGYDIPYEQVEDTMVMARTRMFRGIGLKNQVETNLGIPDWSVDINEYLSAMSNLLDASEKKGLRYLLKKSGNPTDVVDLVQMNLSEVINMIHKPNDGDSKIYIAQYGSLMTLIRVTEAYGATEIVWNYLMNEINKLDSLDELSRSAYFYDIPSAMIAKYGALDAIMTNELYEFNLTSFKYESSKYHIEMMKGYRLALRHYYLAMIFSSNGMAWDEKRASYYEKIILADGKDNAINLIKLAKPYLRSVLRHNLTTQMVDYDLSHRSLLTTVLRASPDFIGIDKSGTIRYRTMLSNGRSIKKKYKIADYHKLYQYLPQEYIDQLWNEFFDYYIKLIESDDSYEFLRIADDLQIASPQVAQAMTLEWIHDNWTDFIEGTIYTLLADNMETLLNELKDSGKLDDNYLAYLEDIKNHSRHDIFDLWNRDYLLLINYSKTAKALYKKMKGMIIDNTLYYDPDGSQEAKLGKSVIRVGDYYALADTDDDPHPFLLSGSEPSMLTIFATIFKGVVDTEDMSTWSDEYWYLHYYRMVKKCLKMKLSYIDSNSLGRGLVSIVDKKESDAGKITPRIKTHVDPRDYVDDNRYQLISDIKFRAYNTLTGRWSSGLHTIPWKSPAREFFGSRYLGGIVIAPDYSQAEVRILAATSQEDNLLRAYREGIDVHTMTAKGIFGEHVTDAQRRYSKMACVAGSTKVLALDGKTYSLEEIYNEPDLLVGKHVISFHPDKGVVPRKVLGVQLTKEVTELTKVTFDNGDELYCTSDHPLLMYGKEDKYIDAQDSLDHEIETLYYRSTNQGGRYIGYLQWRDTYWRRIWSGKLADHISGKWLDAHVIAAREYGLEVTQGYQVHHKDHDRWNNSEDNLELISVSNHQSHDHNLLAYSKVMDQLEDQGLEVNRDNYESARSRYVMKWDNIIEKYGNNYPRIPRLRFFDHNITYDKPTGLRVAKVEVIKYDEPVPVYDLCIEDTHNYAIYLSEGVGVFTHNTFTILYGGTPQKFARDNLNGDIAQANRIYDGFYSTYPKVKDWIASKHKEFKDHGLVTLMTNRYIPISVDPSNPKKAMNQSQNFPIQGTSSDITGDTMFQMYKYLRDHNMKSKPFSFVHDSLELDIHPSEIFEFIPVADDLMNNYSMREYGVPLKADMVFGKSYGEEIELIKIDPDNRTIECEGFKDDLDRVLVEWNQVFDKVEVDIISEKDEYIPRSDLWVAKKGYDLYLGKYRKSMHCIIKLGRYIGG